MFSWMILEVWFNDGRRMLFNWIVQRRSSSKHVGVCIREKNRRNHLNWGVTYSRNNRENRDEQLRFVEFTVSSTSATERREVSFVSIADDTPRTSLRPTREI